MSQSQSQSRRVPLSLTVAVALIFGACISPVAHGQKSFGELMKEDAEREKAKKDAITAYYQNKAGAQQNQAQTLEQILAERKRWKILPDSAQGMHQDASGHVWFVGSGNLKAFRTSVQRAAAGETQVIANGHVLLLDRSGRIWVKGLPNPFAIQWYDGKQWQMHPPAAEPGRLLEQAWEDAGGNIHFIRMIRSNWLVERYGRDGQWKAWTVTGKGSGSVTEPARFVEQAGGRITIYAADSATRKSSGPCCVLHYDGTQWAEYDVRLCRAVGHDIRMLMPMADGSIWTICSGGQLWVFRPPGLSTTQPASRQPDPVNHLRPEPLGARYRFQNISTSSSTAGKQCRLLLDHAIDLQAQKRYEYAFLLLGSDGQWQMQPIPLQQWRRAGFYALPRGMADSKGNLWEAGALCIDAGLNLVPVAPDGLSYDAALCEDSNGRIYLRRHPQYVIYDPSAPEPKSDLPSSTFQAAKLTCLQQQNDAWGIDDVSSPEALVHLGPGGKAQPIPGAWQRPDAGIDFVIPLRGGAMVRLNIKEEMLWDGASWHKAGDFPALIRANAPLLLKMAGNNFLGYAAYLHQSRVATDGKGCLWAARDGETVVFIDDPNPNATQYVIPPYFAYYDGTAWHDVWAELGSRTKPERSKILGAVNSGKTVLVTSDLIGTLLAVSHESGKLRCQDLGVKRNFGSPIDGFIDDPNGRWWIYLDGKLLRHNNGTLQPVAGRGLPLYSDTRGAAWFVDETKPILRVQLNEVLTEATVQGLTRDAAMTQSPDGRLWLLHRERLSQVEARNENGRLAIRELGRWSWGSPRNLFQSVFCDDSGGLWIRGHGSRVSRFSLPTMPPSR